MGESYRPVLEDHRDSAEFDRGLEHTEFGLVFKNNVSIAEYKAFARKFANKLGFLPESSPSFADYTRSLKRSREIPTNLEDIDLSNIEIINFLREKAGFDSLMQEEYEILQNQTTGVENSMEQLAPEEPVISEGEESNISQESSEVVSQELIDPAIASRIQSYTYPTRSANPNDYVRGFNLPEWLLINTETEQEVLVQGIKASGIMPKLTDLPNYELIKAQQKSGDLSGEYLNFVNATRELYGLPVYGFSTDIAPEVGVDDNSVEGSDPAPEILDDQEPILENSTSLGNSNAINKEVIYHDRDEGLNTILDKYLPDDESVPELTSDTELQQALKQAIATAEAQLATETEISSVDETIIPKTEINLQELEKLKQEAHEAITVYQQFGQEHPYHTRDQATQEKYRQLEATAWEAQNRFAHINGGEVFILPQKRDIELSHPEVKDTKDYLESLGYGFDERSNIITIKHHNQNIELNRPYDISNLIDRPRPAHILTDINLDNTDLDLHHIGYVLPGLNPQTPDFIISTLSKDEFIQGVIVDDPWETPIEYILPESGKELETSSSRPTPLLAPDAESRKNNKDFAIETLNIQESQTVQFAELRAQYARAEEFYNKNRGDETAKSELERLREEYNQTVEKVLDIMAAEGLELEIHKIFTQEVKNLRDERIVQSQELQGDWEKKLNPIKEKFLNFAIKHKKSWAVANISLAVAGGFFALSGAGLPVAGALAATRRSIGSIMSGVSAREGTRSVLEDADIKLGTIKWQAAIPKLVGESLQDGYIKGAKDADLSTKLSTLEAYYRLNGGKFTNESQQTAYESILNELGTRVQQENIANQAEKEVVPANIHEMKDDTISSENSNIEGEVKAQPEKFVFSSPEQNQQYTSRLLTVLSETRITELQKQQQKRLIADIVGTTVGGSLMSVLAVDTMRPGGIFNPEQITNTPKPDIIDSPDNPSVETSPETATPNPTEISPVKPNIPSPEGAESMNELAKEATQQLSAEQLQDISELNKGETLWGEIAKKLGTDATEAQIQQGVETYMQSTQGSETIFNLASQTEAGKALLVELGVDNAQELSQLSNTDLYEITKHLGIGQLQGLDSLDLHSITADTIDTSTIPPINIPAEEIFIPAATPEQLLSKFTQAPDILDFPEGAKPLTQINNYIDRFAGDLPYDSSLGQEVLTTYLNTPEGKDWLYDAIVNNPERLTGNQNIQFVEEYFRQKGIKSGADIDWANLTQDKRFPTSIFWRETTLTGGRRIPPLSTLLKPGPMPGIKKALQLVLTKQ